MTRTRLGVLGLCVMVLGLMAVSAGAAQAAKLLILNAARTEEKELNALLVAEVDTTQVLLTTILGIKTEILCSALSLVGMEAAGKEGKINETGKVKYTGCDVKLNGTLNKECEAHSNGSPVGTIETLALKGGLRLVEGGGLIVLEPTTGSSVVGIEMGPGCPIGSKVPINGTIDLEDCEGKLETLLVKHLMQSNKLTKLTALGNAATLDGNWWLKLAGEHLNLEFMGEKE